MRSNSHLSKNSIQRLKKDHVAEGSDLLEDYVNRKSLAVIGGSEAIIGTRLGEKIDSYDVVVRINCHWPCPLTIKSLIDVTDDIGKRTDVLFGSFGYMKIGRLKKMSGVKLIVLTNFATRHMPLDIKNEKRTKGWNDRRGKKWKQLTALCEDRNIEYYWYAERHETMLLNATSGLLALKALLLLPVTELFIAGFDFYCLGTPQKAWVNHDPVKERNYFREHIASDKRVVLHEHVQESLRLNFQGIVQIEQDNIKL